MAKLNKKKLNKLANIIVLAISAIVLSLFFYFFFIWNSVSNTHTTEISKCDRRTVNQEICYSNWNEYYNNFIKDLKIPCYIGFGLPIIYFGGKALIKWLTNEDK